MGGWFGISDDEWLVPGQTALLIVDVQNYDTKPRYDITKHHPFSSGGSKAYFDRVNNVLANVQNLLDLFRGIGWKVIYTCYGFEEEDGSDLPTLWRHVTLHLKDGKGIPYKLKKGSDAWKIHEAIAPIKGETVLTKTTNSTFQSTNLDIILRQNRIRTLVVCGGWTNACVESTIREATDKGYLCTLVQDCCLGPDEDAHQRAVKNMGNFYCRVKSLAEVTQEISPMIEHLDDTDV